MSDKPTLDPETATLEELKAAAIAEAENKGPEKVEVPRIVEAEPEIFVARREIDLGDGSGVQVFESEGDSKEAALEALTDKITEAQTNATKKIRAQEAELRELRSKTAEKPKPKELTDDEKYVMKQEFEKDPYAAFDKIFQQRTGMTMEELQRVKSRLDAEDRAQQVNQSLAAFLATHEDFVDCDKNSAAMKLALQSQDINSESLHKAYLHLKQSGLLELKGSEANADTVEKPSATERIVQPRVEAPQTRTKKTSGISTQARPAVPPAEPSEDDAYNMPLDKLRQLANRQLAAR